MSDLFQSGDGANKQAQAVKAWLAGYYGIECSWDSEERRYLALPKIDRWHNCREQGYVITLCNYPRQLNIVFYEYRSADILCIVTWEGRHTINPPTIDTVPEGVFERSHDYNYSFAYGEIRQCADKIMELMSDFWSNEPK